MGASFCQRSRRAPLTVNDATVPHRHVPAPKSIELTRRLWPVAALFESVAGFGELSGPAAETIGHFERVNIFATRKCKCFAAELMALEPGTSRAAFYLAAVVDAPDVSASFASPPQTTTRWSEHAIHWGCTGERRPEALVHYVARWAPKLNSDQEELYLKFRNHNAPNCRAGNSWRQIQRSGATRSLADGERASSEKGARAKHVEGAECNRQLFWWWWSRPCNLVLRPRPAGHRHKDRATEMGSVPHGGSCASRRPDRAVFLLRLASKMASSARACDGERSDSGDESSGPLAREMAGATGDGDIENNHRAQNSSEPLSSCGGKKWASKLVRGALEWSIVVVSPIASARRRRRRRRVRARVRRSEGAAFVSAAFWEPREGRPPPLLQCYCRWIHWNCVWHWASGGRQRRSGPTRARVNAVGPFGPGARPGGGSQFLPISSSGLANEQFGPSPDVCHPPLVGIRVPSIRAQG